MVLLIFLVSALISHFYLTFILFTYFYLLLIDQTLEQQFLELNLKNSDSSLRHDNKKPKLDPLFKKIRLDNIAELKKNERLDISSIYMLIYYLN